MVNWNFQNKQQQQKCFDETGSFKLDDRRPRGKSHSIYACGYVRKFDTKVTQIFAGPRGKKKWNCDVRNGSRYLFGKEQFAGRYGTRLAKYLGCHPKCQRV